MKRFLFTTIILLLSTSIFAQDIDVKIVNNAKEYIPQITEDNNLIITDSVSKKQWTIKYSDWLKYARGFENWQIVSKDDPIITSVYETDEYIEIKYNYHNENDSILSGIVTIKKVYVYKESDKSLLYILFGVSGTTILYAIGVTIILIILI